jgi:hypothetical protein
MYNMPPPYYYPQPPVPYQMTPEEMNRWMRFLKKQEKKRKKDIDKHKNLFGQKGTSKATTKLEMFLLLTLFSPVIGIGYLMLAKYLIEVLHNL